MLEYLYLGCFFAITFGLKNTIFFFQSIADSERKLIMALVQSH